MKLSKKEVERREHLRQEETRRELEKVKKRRIVRMMNVGCGCLGERGVLKMYAFLFRRGRKRRRLGKMK